jgi:hypothetical protein
MPNAEQLTNWRNLASRSYCNTGKKDSLELLLWRTLVEVGVTTADVSQTVLPIVYDPILAAALSRLIFYQLLVPSLCK